MTASAPAASPSAGTTPAAAAATPTVTKVACHQKGHPRERWPPSSNGSVCIRLTTHVTTVAAKAQPPTIG
ncbi:MAG: hypothetical protein DWI04_00910 [Planctomycetota bacterium]|nr:MAG: hypothetical protein DWI04_00910 [Planctomycetota bacterium]